MYITVGLGYGDCIHVCVQCHMYIVVCGNNMFYLTNLLLTDNIRTLVYPQTGGVRRTAERLRTNEPKDPQ